MACELFSVKQSIMQTHFALKLVRKKQETEIENQDESRT